MAPKDYDTNEPGIQLVLGNRQVAAVLFMILIIMGLMSTIAYLAGRMSSPVRADSGQPVQKRTEQVIFVDSAKAGDKVARPYVPAPVPAKSTAPAAAIKKEEPAPPVASPPQAPQLLYLQVAATDRNEADTAAAKLKEHSIPARVVPGPTDTTFRVLAGPLADAAHAERVRGTIERAGFTQHFLRLY